MQVTAVAIVGSQSMPEVACRKIARLVVDDLVQAYPLTSVLTVKEDRLGMSVRKYAKTLGLRRYGSSVAEQSKVYSDPEAMAAGHLMWKAQRYIAYWDGSKKGLTAEFIGACLRMKKKLAIFEV